MAITAESLNIILSARDKEFTKALDKSQKNVAKFAKQSQKNLSKTSKSFDSLGSAAKKLAPLIAGVVSVRAAAGAVKTTAAIGKLADIAGVSVVKFQKLAIAAKTVGIEQEKLSDIFKDVSDKVGDFMITGAGPLADFFEFIAPQVGVTADEFKNLSGPDALQLYVSSLEKANVSQSEMVFFMEAIASDASALTPLLKSNGQQMRVLGDEAERTGRILSKDAVDGARELEKEFGDLEKIISTKFSKAITDNKDELLTLVTFFTDTVIPKIGEGIAALDEFFATGRNGGAQPTVGDAAQTAEDLAALNSATPSSAGQNVTGNEMIAQYGLDASKFGATAEDFEAFADSATNEQLKAFNALAAEQNAANANKPKKPKTTTKPKTTRSTTEQTNAYQELLRSLNPVVDATIAYAEQLDTVSDAVQKGQITQEQGNITIGLAREQFDEARRSASEFASVFDTIESNLTSSLMAITEGTSSVKDAFKSMAADVIKELYRVLVVQQLVNSVTGMLGFGGATPSAPPRTRAGGGSVSAGTPFMVGESGRELFVPSQNGRILSPAQTKSASGGDVVNINQSINVTTGVQQTVRAEILGLMPQISASAKSAVLDAKRRGGAFAGAF